MAANGTVSLSGPTISRNSATMFPADDICSLLMLVTSQEIMSCGLAERRALFLSHMAKILNAEIGVWSWGRGGSADGAIQPFAFIDHGMTMQQRTFLAEKGLDQRANREFRALIIQGMGEARQITVVRSDVYSDPIWEAGPFFRTLCHGLGMDSWLTSVRYSGLDTWSNLTFWRKAEEPEFEARERRLIDLAMKSISWLLPTVVETIPVESFSELTHRQRTVLILLLDGLSRKSIARQLKVTEHTIGDHIKSIYQHFGVHSGSELAAKMLRSS